MSATPKENELISPRVGMDKDTHPALLDDSKYSHALNANIENETGNGFPLLQNEPSNLLCIKEKFSQGFLLIGKIGIPEQNRTILFWTNPNTNQGEIGYISNHYTKLNVDDTYVPCNNCGNGVNIEHTPLEEITQEPYCVYTTIVISDCLNFSILHPIIGEYKIESCYTKIYWTDNYNPIRHMDITTDNSYPHLLNEAESEPCDPVYLNSLDCNQINLFPVFKVPCILTPLEGDGGNLKAGSYEFLIAYSTESGDELTAYYSISNPFPIFDRTKVINDGNLDYLTNKSIKLEFVNLEKSAYRYFNLVVVKSINGVISQEIVGTFPTMLTTYNYTGNVKDNIRITLEEIINKKPYYSTAATIVNANNHLLIGNLQTEPDINFQRLLIDYTQLVKQDGLLKWQTIQMTEGLYKQSANVANLRGYMRDEVYAFGISFTNKFGREYCVATIPGRLPNSIKDGSGNLLVEDLLIDVTTDKNAKRILASEHCTDTTRDKYWQFYNTGFNRGFGCGNPSVNVIQTNHYVDYSTCASFTFSINRDTNTFYVFDPTTNTYKPLVGLPTTCKMSFDCDDCPTYTGCPDITPGVSCSSLLQAPPGAYNVVITQEPYVYPDDLITVSPAGKKIINNYTESVIVNPPPAPSDSPCPASNTNCNNATWLSAMSIDDCPAGPTYGCFDNTGGSTTCCFGSSDTNQTWFTFIATQNAHSIRLGTNNNPVIEVFGGSCSALTPVGHVGNPASTCVNGSYVVLDNLTIGQQYWIKVYSVDSLSTGSSDNYFGICLGTPTPTSQTEIDVLEEVKLVCKFKIEYDIDEEIDPNCEGIPYQYGEFSYWESTAIYPDNKDLFGELACQPIRHHKFPDNCLSTFHNGQNDGNPTVNKNNYVYPIGIKLDVADIKAMLDWGVTNTYTDSSGNVRTYLTREQADNIQSYKIVRGNRVNNKSIIAKGLLFDMWSYRDDIGIEDGVATNYPYLYSNYPYNDLHRDPYLANTSLYYRDKDKFRSGSYQEYWMTPVNNGDENHRFTFHSPEIHFNNPTLGTEIKFESVEYGKVNGRFSTVRTHPKYVLLTLHAYIVADTLAGVEVFIDENVYLYEGLFAHGIWGAAGHPMRIPGDILKGIINTFKYRTQWLEIFKALADPKQYAYYFSSHCKYNAFSCDLNRDYLLFPTENTLYLKPGNLEFVERNIPLRINNWNRESSVYIRLTQNVPAVHVSTGQSYLRDNSRYINSEIGCVSTDETRIASSYYVSMKNYKADQYGTYYDVDYISTGNCGIIDWKNENQSTACDTIFGGDTFITRFGLKRKLSFFTQTAVGLNEEDDFVYSFYTNVAYPIYYFDTKTGGLSGSGDGSSDSSNASAFAFQNLAEKIGTHVNLDCDTTSYKTGKKDYQYKGKIFLYSYGVPYFLVESDYNLDMRHGLNSREKNFYPNVGDVTDWTQEVNVPISEDNYYLYNTDYSKQPKEAFFCKYSPYFNISTDCRNKFKQRVIYSQQSKNDNDTFDAWLSFKIKDFFDFDGSNGALLALHSLESAKVLARFENIAQLFNAYSVIKATPYDIQTGNGGMFAQKPQEFMKTPLGFSGTSNIAFESTEFGYFWTDAKRGEIYQLVPNGGIQVISINGLKNWFKENLPFRILQDFPEVDIDNAYNKIGIISVWDSRYKRYIITKRDYALLPNKQVVYSAGDFYDVSDPGTPVKIRNGVLNTSYFCNKSFTVGYSPITKNWISYYSFTPDFYIGLNNYFQSGLNFGDSSSTGLWSHLLTNRSYQVFYGKLYPFEVENVTKDKVSQKYLTSIEYSQDAYRYHNEYDYAYMPNITFNKAFIYNQSSGSGILNLNVKKRNSQQATIQYPKYNLNSVDIEIAKVESYWRFNQFADLTRDKESNVPLLTYDCSNVLYNFAPTAINYKKPYFSKGKLRGAYYKVKLVNDVYSNYKFIYRWMINKPGFSIT